LECFSALLLPLPLATHEVSNLKPQSPQHG
jgi:hypothetical protein